MKRNELIKQIIAFNQGNPLLSARTTSQFLGVSRGTLSAWRSKKVKLDFIQEPAVGKKVLYHASAIATYLLNNTVYIKKDAI